MKKGLSILLLLTCILSNVYSQSEEKVYFTTGLKIGEITESSVIIWTRLCKPPQAVQVYHKQKEAPFKSPIDFDNNMPVSKMEGAVEGAFGQVKIQLKSGSLEINTEWTYVSEYKDFTLKKKIENLEPNTEYSIIIQGRKGPNAPITEIKGGFITAPLEQDNKPILFTSSTCQYYWSFDDQNRGFKIYDSMLKLNPLFHCQTGDFVYYDKPGPLANNVELARHKWHAMNSWPSLVDFYKNTPLYLQKDDHDLLKDDASPFSTPYGDLSYNDGLAIWREQAPIEGKPYRTFRWGKDLQIWLVEVREFRSDNKDQDGPNKTMWGEDQKEWFKKTIEASDATFKILVSPTPIIGPDRESKIDNHANNAYKTEGDWLRKYLADQKMLVINGDRHWQYVSVDPKTGLWEFSQGPSSDSHAQGWEQGDVKPEHRFLRVKGGFLATQVYRENGVPLIKFTHYDVDGKSVHEETIKR